MYSLAIFVLPGLIALYITNIVDVQVAILRS